MHLQSRICCLNTSNGTVNDITQNGASGVQTGYAIVYQWATTIPSAPSGTTTYTWATGEVAAVPTGWYATPTTAPKLNTCLNKLIMLHLIHQLMM